MHSQEEYDIFRRIEKQYHMEDIENMLVEKYGYEEDNIPQELLEQIYYYYYKGLENDDSWRIILEEAIDSTFELLKERKNKDE